MTCILIITAVLAVWAIGAAIGMGITKGLVKSLKGEVSWSKLDDFELSRGIISITWPISLVPFLLYQYTLKPLYEYVAAAVEGGSK